MSGLQNLLDTHDEEIEELDRRFAGYVFPTDKSVIRNWLRQFGEEHFMLGLKLLHFVDYYSPSRLVNESGELHRQLLAYLGYGARLDDRELCLANRDMVNRPTYFVDLSPFSGKSQSEFIPKYSLGAKLRGEYDERFIFLSDFPEVARDPGRTLIFLTDFIGSGSEVRRNLTDMLWAFRDENEHLLLAICGYESGIKTIKDDFGDKLTIITNKLYPEKHKAFSPDNGDFTETERKVLLQFCQIADDLPTGYQGTQATTVFCFRCPNDTISILRANNRRWKGLFKRHPY